MPTTSFSRILCHCKFVMIGVNESTSQRVAVMCRTLWCHLLSLPYEFSIFKNLGGAGWKPWVKIISGWLISWRTWATKKFWPGGLLILYITCHRLPGTINEPFFFSQYLGSFVRFTEVVACHVWIFRLKFLSLYNAGCICEAMSKMVRLLITPGKC